MGKGRKAKPAEQKRAEGNPGRRKIPDEVKPEELGNVPEPPDYLGAVAAEYWRRWAPELVRLRLLTKLDLPEFERLCAGYAVWRKFWEAVRDEENLMHQHFGEYRRAGEALNKLAAQFGINPVSRAPLHTPKEEGKPSAMQAHLEKARAAKGIGPPPGQE